MGSVSMMALLDLTTFIYWAQLSQCQAITDDDVVLQQYSCDNKTAYGFTSAFACLLCVLQCYLALALFRWRGDLVNEQGPYDEIYSNSVTDNSGRNASPNPFPGPTNNSKAAASADL
jgi:hypothetical protein